MNIEKAITDASIVFRRPMMSVTAPTVIAPTMTPTQPDHRDRAAVLGVRPQAGSFSSEGSTTPSTTRSYPSSATAIQHNGATQPA